MEVAIVASPFAKRDMDVDASHYSDNKSKIKSTPPIFEAKNMFVNLNGQIVTDNDYKDLKDADGIFESMAWSGGIALWDLHFDRLQHAGKELGYDTHFMNKDFLLEEIKKTVAISPVFEHWKIKLSLFKENNDINFLIESLPYQPFKEALVLGIATVAEKNYSMHSHLKTITRNEYEAVQKEAADNNWDDAILLNKEGRVVESSIANVFWKKDDQYFTIPLSEGCIAGVGRRHFMIHHSVREEKIYPEALHEADAVFLTNALRGIIEVKEIKRFS